MRTLVIAEEARFIRAGIPCVAVQFLRRTEHRPFASALPGQIHFPVLRSQPSLGSARATGQENRTPPGVLARLAELYQCSVADLVIDLADYSNLDTARATSGDLNGLWLSRYSYFSTGRDASLQGEHTIRLHHTGSRLHGTNDPADGESRLTLDLSVSGAIATGTWKERTAPTGYYRGAVYHGTIQLVVSPHARGMNGRWLGFGKNFIVNSGDWHLEWLEA
ncbi:hypothetical protein [Kribbella soli]|uniref:hypothetical protein n=1 Tax=Kribbella soli TaxID=1124743 RepID=UPI00192D393D|nr:hypothetical protein [Kribbella soli]